MFPSIVDFGVHDLPLLGETHLFLPTYGVLFAAGAVMAWVWLMRRGRALGIRDDLLFNLAFYSILAGLLGAKVALVLVEWRYYMAHPAEILGTIRSAGVLMGGVIAGAVTFLAYCRHHGLPMAKLADAAAAPVALAQAVGRLGCFAAGCCWGVPASQDNPLAVTFTDPAAAAQTGVPLHEPLVGTQWIQSLNDLVLAVLLTWMWRRRVQPDGTTAVVYVLLYSISRFVIEFWRGDTVRGMYLGGRLSTSQLLGLATAAIAVAVLVRIRRRRGAAA